MDTSQCSDSIVNLIDVSLGDYKEMGGPTSGFRGHKGRKGKRGGSVPSRGRIPVDILRSIDPVSDVGKEILVGDETYVVLQHGTTDKNLQSILEHGLVGKEVAGIGREETLSKDLVYLTGYGPQALGWANSAAEKYGGNPLVVTTLVPKDLVVAVPEWPGGIEKYMEVGAKGVSKDLLASVRRGRGIWTGDIGDFEEVGGVF